MVEGQYQMSGDAAVKAVASQPWDPECAIAGRVSAGAGDDGVQTGCGSNGPAMLFLRIQTT